jgi:hypothetical protein
MIRPPLAARIVPLRNVHRANTLKPGRNASGSNAAMSRTFGNGGPPNHSKMPISSIICFGFDAAEPGGGGPTPGPTITNVSGVSKSNWPVPT